MKKWIKKIIPNKKTIENKLELKKLKPYFKKSSHWSSDREPIARGVAAGLAGAVIPGFQFFYAALLAILLRGNIPVALLATFITNPFTVVPIIYFISLVGGWIIGNQGKKISVQHFHWDFSSFANFWSNFNDWILQFGKDFLVGLPIVSICLGVIGYFGTILIWKIINKK